jgi:hypothetical protein
VAIASGKTALTNTLADCQDIRRHLLRKLSDHTRSSLEEVTMASSLILANWLFPIGVGVWTGLWVWLTIRFGRRQERARAKIARITFMLSVGLGLVFYSIPIQRVAGPGRTSALATLVLVLGALCVLAGAALWLVPFLGQPQSLAKK